jgi:hypothetical protein
MSLLAVIAFYEKGYSIKNDYYNGINLAYLLNVRACETGDGEDAMQTRFLPSVYVNKWWKFVKN